MQKQMEKTINKKLILVMTYYVEVIFKKTSLQKVESSLNQLKLKVDDTYKKMKIKQRILNLTIVKLL